jgi:malate dehydrogenase (oxaloacetate-decarboxylating)
MLLAAAYALAENSPALNNPSAPLLPSLTDVRRVAAEMAFAVGLAAQQEGVAPKTTPEELRLRVQRCQWAPEYSRIGYPETNEVEVFAMKRH